MNDADQTAPRWALCSDCLFENLPTCATTPTCWHPMETADLAPDDARTPADDGEYL